MAKKEEATNAAADDAANVGAANDGGGTDNAKPAPENGGGKAPRRPRATKAPKDTTAVVVPEYDRYFSRGKPGEELPEGMWGFPFKLEENGDATLNMPNYCADDFIKAGKVIRADEHIPKAPASEEEKKRVAAASGALKV